MLTSAAYVLFYVEIQPDVPPNPLYPLSFQLLINQKSGEKETIYQIHNGYTTCNLERQ